LQLFAKVSDVTMLCGGTAGLSEPLENRLDSDATLIGPLQNGFERKTASHTQAPANPFASIVALNRKHSSI
jgi:hypothetical protein